MSLRPITALAHWYILRNAPGLRMATQSPVICTSSGALICQKIAWEINANCSHAQECSPMFFTLEYKSVTWLHLLFSHCYFLFYPCRTMTTIFHPRSPLLCRCSVPQTSSRWSRLTPYPSDCTGETASVEVSNVVVVSSIVNRASLRLCG